MAIKLAQIYQDLELSNQVNKTIRSCLLLQLWKGVVDERVGKNTEPVKIFKRTLYMTTTSSSWAQELSFLKREIIAKFNQLAGEEVIQDIRFKVTG